jgi:hypothetical protein
MNLSDIRFFLSEIYTYSNIPVLIIGFFSWTKLSKELKYLLIASLINFGIAYFSNLTVKWGWSNNLFLNYLSTVNDTIFMTYFFSTIVNHTLTKKIIIIGGCINFVISFVDALWVTGYMNPNSISGSIETFCVILVSIYCLDHIIKKHKEKLLLDPLFWATLAILLINTFSLFPQLFNLQLYLYSPDLFFQFDIFDKFILIIANLFYALAFWYAKPKTQTL